MPEAAGTSLKRPPGAGRDWKEAPASVVVAIFGHSREPHRANPSTHHWLGLTAVNEVGTNRAETEDLAAVDTKALAAGVVLGTGVWLATVDVERLAGDVVPQPAKTIAASKMLVSSDRSPRDEHLLFMALQY
jgi:hypothetical protein